MKKILILAVVIFAFVNNYAMANGVIKEKDGKFGLYNDATHKLILPYEYDKIINDGFSNFKIIKNNKFGYYVIGDDNKADFDLKPLYDGIERLYMEPNIYKVKVNGKYGLALKNKGVVLPAIYDDVLEMEHFTNAVCKLYHIVKNNNKYAIYDLGLKSFVLPFDMAFDEYFYSDDDDSLILKTKNKNKIGLFNPYDFVVFPVKFDEIKRLMCDTYILKNNNKKGFYYKRKMVLPIEYDEISKDLVSYQIILEKDNKQAIFNYENGEFILPFKYVKVTPVLEGFYKLKDNSGKSAFFSLPSKELLPCDCDDITDKYVLIKGDKFGLYSKDGKEVALPCKYQEIKSIDSLNYSVKLNDKYGIYNIQKKAFVLPIEYDGLMNTYYGFEIKKDGKMGIFDLFGSKVLIPAEYNLIEAEYLPQNYGDKIYKCKIGKKCKKYCFDGLSGNQKNVGIVYAKTAGIILGKTVLTPVAVVGDILLDLTPLPLWGYTMSTDANGDLHVFHTYSYKLWGGWSN